MFTLLHMLDRYLVCHYRLAYTHARSLTFLVVILYSTYILHTTWMLDAVPRTNPTSAPEGIQFHTLHVLLFHFVS